MIEKTVCELFAGVGGFRCGLNNILSLDNLKKPEKWKTVWFNQWEPKTKKQYAHGCYVRHFGTAVDKCGHDTTNMDISVVDKDAIPDHNLLVAGFPCQDYSVARTLSGGQGIQGKKGVLWWSLLDVLKAKKPPFVLLENVDRLLKSPSVQRGRDFGMILGSLRNEGYNAEWRVINAAEYGFIQRRRRTFIFAYRNTTKFSERMTGKTPEAILRSDGFFAGNFPVSEIDTSAIGHTILDTDLVSISEFFSFGFQNSGIMINGNIFTVGVSSACKTRNVLKDVLETGDVSEDLFIEKNRLFWTDPAVTSSDETEAPLSRDARRTWQYIKGSKKCLRESSNGHRYVYTEGAIPMIDRWYDPARTILTSEGRFSRSTHLVRDLQTERIRLLSPVETERLNEFPDNWTEEFIINGEICKTPKNARYFEMGNALIVGLIS